MCDSRNCKNKIGGKEDGDVAKALINETYKKLNLSKEKIKKISITPKVEDGKLILNKKNKNHRYIMGDD